MRVKKYIYLKLILKLIKQRSFIKKIFFFFQWLQYWSRMYPGVRQKSAGIGPEMRNHAIKNGWRYISVDCMWANKNELLTASLLTVVHRRYKTEPKHCRRAAIASDRNRASRGLPVLCLSSRPSIMIAHNRSPIQRRAASHSNMLVGWQSWRLCRPTAS